MVLLRPIKKFFMILAIFSFFSLTLETAFFILVVPYETDRWSYIHRSVP